MHEHRVGMSSVIPKTIIVWHAGVIIRDISDQELISCLHDQPRLCTFTTGDLLLVYTQYNENEQHILWFDIYDILYINLCD